MFRLHFFPERGYTLEAMDAAQGASSRTLAEAIDRLQAKLSQPITPPHPETVARVLSLFEMILHAERPPSDLPHP